MAHKCVTGLEKSYASVGKQQKCPIYHVELVYVWKPAVIAPPSQLTSLKCLTLVFVATSTIYLSFVPTQHSSRNYSLIGINLFNIKFKILAQIQTTRKS